MQGAVRPRSTPPEKPAEQEQFMARLTWQKMKALKMSELVL